MIKTDYLILIGKEICIQNYFQKFMTLNDSTNNDKK